MSPIKGKLCRLERAACGRRDGADKKLGFALSKSAAHKIRHGNVQKLGVIVVIDGDAVSRNELRAVVGNLIVECGNFVFREVVLNTSGFHFVWLVAGPFPPDKKTNNRAY